MKRIDCKKVTRWLRGGPLSDLGLREREAVERHIVECELCRSLYDRLARVDRDLSLLCVEPPVLRQPHVASFAASRLRFAGYAALFALAAIAGTGFGVRYGAGKLFGEGFAADLDHQVQGLRDMDFDAGSFTRQDWTATGSGVQGEFPLESLEPVHQDVPNFYALDDRVSHSSEGRSLKLYLRSFGGAVRRTIVGPFPAGTVVRVQSWVLMPQPGSTRNKWLSFGVSTLPLTQGEKGQSASIDVFDASPVWRPYLLTMGLASGAHSLEISFSTGAGDGSYLGWDRAAWIDDVQVSISIPIHGEAATHGDVVTARLTPPPNFTLSADPRDLELWTYGGKLPNLRPTRVEQAGRDVVCTYMAVGLAELIAGGNPDTGTPGLPIQVRTRLRRDGLAFEGTWGTQVNPTP